MDEAVFVFCARGAVAAGFLLSAVWKVRNPDEFRLAFRRAAPHAWIGLDRIALPSIIAAEGLIACALLIPTTAVEAAWLGLVTLLVFTGVLLRQGTRLESCGCWGRPQGAVNDSLYAHLLIARNVLLCCLCAAASLDIAPATGAMVFGYLVGALAGAVIIELPYIGEVATIEKRPPRPSGASS
jgi:hypothetical protein